MVFAQSYIVEKLQELTELLILFSYCGQYFGIISRVLNLEQTSGAFCKNLKHFSTVSITVISEVGPVVFQPEKKRQL